MGLKKWEFTLRIPDKTPSVRRPASIVGSLLLLYCHRRRAGDLVRFANSVAVL